MMLSPEDLAKYPFTAEAAKYVKDMGLTVEDIASQEFVSFLGRAKERIKEALQEDHIVQWPEKPDYRVEIMSFPVSIIIVLSTENSFLGKQYALAEAKRASKLLKDEKNEKIIRIASSSFKWDVQTVIGDMRQYYDFKLSFITYLKDAPIFHDYKWKLVNRFVNDGYVFLVKNELVRLIEEEVKKEIQRLVGGAKPKIPSSLTQAVEDLKPLIAKHYEFVRAEEPLLVMVEEAYPPCIRSLSENLLSNHSIPHLGRFTLTSFLLNIGMSIEDVVKLFTSATDFDENLTRYQIEHIAGKRGSGIKYTPPNCETLKTHGLCPGMDELCKRIKHPLAYYRSKLRLTKAGRVAVKSE